MSIAGQRKLFSRHWPWAGANAQHGASADTEAHTEMQRKAQALTRELADCRQALAASLAREEQALHAARHDALTGLPNRRAFDQRARGALQWHQARAQNLCVVFIDLDGFKTINDELGHAAGDALLRLVGARLSAALRSDDIISRHGGDEFVCLLPAVQDNAQATERGRQLQAAIAQPCQLQGQRVQVRASLGLALFPTDGLTLEALVASADQAMLQAKRPHSRSTGPLRSVPVASC